MKFVEFLTEKIASEFFEIGSEQRLSIILHLNEKESCIIFPNQNGEPNLSEMFYSTDPQFHEWYLDYFEHSWKKLYQFSRIKTK